MKLHYQEVVQSDWFFQLFTLGFQSPQAGGALVGAGVEKGPGGQLAEQLDALGWTAVAGGLSWWIGSTGVTSQPQSLSRVPGSRGHTALNFDGTTVLCDSVSLAAP